MTRKMQGSGSHHGLQRGPLPGTPVLGITPFTLSATWLLFVQTEPMLGLQLDGSRMRPAHIPGVFTLERRQEGQGISGCQQ